MTADAWKIMFLGTGSDMGKSVTATAFRRILKNRLTTGWLTYAKAHVDAVRILKIMGC